MLLSGKLSQNRDYVALPKAITPRLDGLTRVVIRCAAFAEVEAHVHVIRTKDGRVRIPIPFVIQECYALSEELELALEPSTLDFAPKNPVCVPLELKFIFKACAQVDGSIQLPRGYFYGMRAQRWADQIRATIVDGQGRSFKFDREIKHRPATARTAESVVFYIPDHIWLNLPKDSTFTITIECLQQGPEEKVDFIRADEVVDWLGSTSHRAFLTQPTDPTFVTINAARSELQIRRLAPLRDLAWLLGFYLAEGSKKNFKRWTVSQKGPDCLRRCRDALTEVLGLRLHDLSLEVLYHATPRAEALAFYSNLGIVISSVRETSDDRESLHAGVLSIRGSAPFNDLFTELLRLFCARVTSFSDGVQREFLLGCLAGDGGFTLADPPRVVYAAASVLEGQIVMSVYDHFLGRAVSTLETTEPKRAVNFVDAVKLLSWGAFSARIPRARLFFYAADIVAKLEAGQRLGFASHGYFQGAEFSPEVKEALELWHGPLAEEAAYVARRYPTRDDVVLKICGAPYRFDPEWRQAATKSTPLAVLRRVGAAKKVSNAESAHHPVEKQAQIQRVLSDQADLLIYEAHAGKGGCTATYTTFGEVISRTAEHGDAEQLLIHELATGGTYHVVDLDPYGYPLRMLIFALQLLSIAPAWFFVTCPNPKRIYRVSSTHISRGLGLRDDFDCNELVDLIVRLGAMHNITLVEVDRLDLGSVWRLAFKRINAAELGTTEAGEDDHGD